MPHRLGEEGGSRNHKGPRALSHDPLTPAQLLMLPVSFFFFNKNYPNSKMSEVFF